MPAPISVTGAWAKVFFLMSMLDKTTIPRIKNVAFVFMFVIVDVLHGFEYLDKGLVLSFLKFFQDRSFSPLFRGVTVVFRFTYFKCINL